MLPVADHSQKVPAEWRSRLPYLWYAALALLIAAPLMRGGYLLLLDLALVKNITVQWWPTAVQPGPVNIAPIVFALWLLVKLGWVAGPILVSALFFAMGASMHRAVITLLQPKSIAPAHLAATAYTVNPFVYERLMAGHLLFLMAYSLAPLLIVATIRCARAPGFLTGLRWGLLVGVSAWISLHYLVMQFAVTIPLALFHRSMRTRDGVRCAFTGWGMFIMLNLWWIIGIIVQPPGQFITEADAGVYATQPESASVAGNVAALYGFWRHEFKLPKDGVDAWWMIAVPMVGLILYGIVLALRSAKHRPLGLTMLMAIPLSILLGSGTSFPPTRGVFLWIFREVPGFALFREPQKWAALLPLSYAIFSAIALESLLSPETKLHARHRFAIILVTLVAVLVYGNSLLWNWDRLRPSRFPADWQRVDDIVTSNGGGTMLFLPWHLYMSLSFTGGRVVNPAPYYFSFPVISGDNLEVPGIRTQSSDPRSFLIESVLTSDSHTNAFMKAMRGLCIEWIGLANEVDASRYAWLNHTEGLTPVFTGLRMSLYHVAGLSGCPRDPSDRIDSVVSSNNFHDSSSALPTARPPHPLKHQRP